MCARVWCASGSLAGARARAHRDQQGHQAVRELHEVCTARQRCDIYANCIAAFQCNASPIDGNMPRVLLACHRPYDMARVLQPMTCVIQPMARFVTTLRCVDPSGGAQEVRRAVYAPAEPFKGVSASVARACPCVCRHLTWDAVFSARAVRGQWRNR